MIHLLTGPMGASKSARLVQLYRESESHGLRPLALQLEGTARPGEKGWIVSRTGERVPAVVVGDLHHARYEVGNAAPRLVCLDELHIWGYRFGVSAVLEMIGQISARGHVAVACLNRDWQGRKIEPAAAIAGWADVHHETLAAPCMAPEHERMDCQGTRSWLITEPQDGKPPVGDLARLEGGQWVGGEYAVLCRDAFERRQSDRHAWRGVSWYAGLYGMGG